MMKVKLRKLCAPAAACFLMFAFTGACRCQETESDFCRNAIYVEIFGPGLLYSINYDRLITRHTSLRAGVSKWSFPAFFFLVNGSIDFTGFPVTLNYLAGEGNSRLELGAGIVPMLVSLDGEEIFFGESVRGRATAVLGTASVGYRYQPMDGGFVFRIGFTPVFNFDKVFPTGGLSVGVAF